MSDSTAVTTTKPALPAHYAEEIMRRKEFNAVATAIRGTVWGKEASEGVVRAVAEYARRIGADAVRHVEILGGRIYLTADYYREKAAPLIAAGLCAPPEFEQIAADARLDTLAAGDSKLKAWAEEERDRRMVLRIKHGVPEGAKAATICRIAMRNGTALEGVNWVGGTSKRDPVGDSEPTKTAESRAERRAWRRLVEVQPTLMPDAVRAESLRDEVNESIPDAEVTAWGKPKELPVRAPSHSPIDHTAAVVEFGGEPQVAERVVGIPEPLAFPPDTTGAFDPDA